MKREINKSKSNKKVNENKVEKSTKKLLPELDIIDEEENQHQVGKTLTQKLFIYAYIALVILIVGVGGYLAYKYFKNNKGSLIKTGGSPDGKIHLIPDIDRKHINNLIDQFVDI